MLYKYWIIAALAFLNISGLTQEQNFVLSKFEWQPKIKKAITVMLPAMDDSNSFYIGTAGDGIFHFLSKTKQWYSRNTNLISDSAKYVSGLVWLNTKNQKVLCLGSKAGLFTSPDSGISWFSTALNKKINCLTAINNFDSLVFAGTDDGIFELNYSMIINNIGLKNKKVTNLAIGKNKFGTYNIYAITEDSLYQTIYIKNQNDSIFKIIYDHYNEKFYDITVNPADPFLIYLAESNRGLYAAEGGLEKFRFKIIRGDLWGYKIEAILHNYNKPNEINVTYYFMSSTDSRIIKFGVYKSYDYGLTWSEIKYEITDSVYNQILKPDGLHFKTIMKLKEHRFILGTQNILFLFFYNDIKQKPQNFIYHFFWKGKKRFYTVGIFSTLTGFLGGLCLNELYHHKSSKKCSGKLPDPPYFP